MNKIPMRQTHLDFHTVKLKFLKQDILAHSDLTQLYFIKKLVGKLISDEIIFSDKEHL